MKRLTRDQKGSIRLAVRDAMFQQIADAEEDMTDCATEEALRAVERRVDSSNDEVWDATQCAVQDEIKKIFMRLYDATKKGEED